MSSDISKNVIWPGWETVRLIGRGGFGAVYEIQRDVAGETEKAALKYIPIPKDKSEINMLRQQNYDDESITAYFTDYKGMFEREYSMMMRMKGHANVVYCEDIRTVQQDDGFGWDIYIKMELLEPLTEHINSGMTEEQIIKLGRDMCSALMYCEKMNVIHRDIKPENIFITREGNYKLGDFGIARTMEGTRTGTVTGTPSFMAPEVANNRRYNSTADIYSLGLTLYWLLNGQTGPFLTPGKKPTPSEKQAAQDRRLRGYSLPEPKYGSSKLNKVVLKACEYDPKERYQTAKEMLDELKKLIAPKHAAPAQPGRDRTENSRTTYRHTKSPTNNTAPKHRKNGTRKPRRKLKLLILADCILLIAALAIWTGFAKNRPERETLPMPTPEPTSIATPMPTPEPTPYVIGISTANNHIALLKSDGKVMVAGDNDHGECNVQDWTDIVAVSAGGDHTVGLKSDGTVVASGLNEDGQCDVQEWTDIVAVSAGPVHTVGLKSDGTVVGVGNSKYGKLNIQNWTNITSVFASACHTIGLRSDGTFVFVGLVDFRQNDIKRWTDIVSIGTGDYHTVGLKRDGTVVTAGNNTYGQCEVQSWTDIVAISTGDFHTVGLRSDGTVVAVGNNTYDQCEVQSWTDIVAISAGMRYTVGLKSDGTVLIATNVSEIRQQLEEAQYGAMIQADYDAAVSLLEQKKFLAARDAFAAMGNYSDSAELAKEALYQRAVLLYELSQKYSMRGIYSQISDSAGTDSVFYIAESSYAEYGSNLFRDIEDICMGDGVEIIIQETPPADFVPVCTDISRLFAELGDYKDSAEYANKAMEAGDFTKPFFDLCASGQLYDAYTWLEAYEDEFESRDAWLSVLKTYIPYCGAWEISSGDPSLIPMTIGNQTPCGTFTSAVKIKDYVITLSIIAHGNGEYPIELPLAAEGGRFSVNNDGVNSFVATLSKKGTFVYSKYSSYAIDAQINSCEYVRIG